MKLTEQEFRDQCSCMFGIPYFYINNIVDALWSLYQDDEMKIIDPETPPILYECSITTKEIPVDEYRRI
jgi:hypothetical protein